MAIYFTNTNQSRFKISNAKSLAVAVPMAIGMPIVAVPIQEVQLLDYAVAHESAAGPRTEFGMNAGYGLTASTNDPDSYRGLLGLMDKDPYTSYQQRERDEYEINDTEWNEVVFEEVYGGSRAKLALHNDWINQKGYQVDAIIEMNLPEQDDRLVSDEGRKSSDTKSLDKEVTETNWISASTNALKVVWNVGDIQYLSMPKIGFQGPFRITCIKHIIPQKKPVDEDEADEYDYRPVTALFTHESNQVYTIDFDNGEQLGVTYQHPIFSTTANDWKLAGELEIGEEVLTKSGNTKVVSSTKKEGSDTVYNLEVKDLHNFLVGESGVVVHNGCSFSDLWGFLKDLLTTAGNHGLPAKIAARMSHKLAAKALKLSGKKLDDFADAVKNADWNKVASMGFDVKPNDAGKIITKGDVRYRTPTFKQNLNKTQGNIETKGSNVSWQQIDNWKSGNQVDPPPGFYSNLHTDIDI